MWLLKYQINNIFEYSIIFDNKIYDWRFKMAPEEIPANLLKNVFKYDVPTDYKPSLNPLKGYLEQGTLVIAKTLGIDEVSAKAKLTDIIKNNRITQFNDPLVKLRKKDRVGDLVESEQSLTSYIKDITIENKIVAPSFTTYTDTDKKKSFHVEFTMSNIARRKAAKKQVFVKKLENKPAEAEYFNSLQKTFKIYNNSLFFLSKSF